MEQNNAADPLKLAQNQDQAPQCLTPHHSVAPVNTPESNVHYLSQELQGAHITPLAITSGTHTHCSCACQHSTSRLPSPPPPPGLGSPALVYRRRRQDSFLATRLREPAWYEDVFNKETINNTRSNRGSYKLGSQTKEQKAEILRRINELEQGMVGPPGPAAKLAANEQPHIHDHNGEEGGKGKGKNVTWGRATLHRRTHLKGYPGEASASGDVPQ